MFISELKDYMVVVNMTRKFKIPQNKVVYCKPIHFQQIFGS